MNQFFRFLSHVDTTPVLAPILLDRITITLIQVRTGRHRRAFDAMDYTWDILNTSNGELFHKVRPSVWVTKVT